MSEPQAPQPPQPQRATQTDSWKLAFLTLAVGIPLLGGAAWVMSGERSMPVAVVAPVAAVAPVARAERAAAPSQPPLRVVEDCNRYAAAATIDHKQVVTSGLLGTAVGAAVGAASGAIINGGKGAGKGAGVGAIAGAAAGTGFGLHDEFQKNEQARIAYQNCMARQGYR